MINELGVVVSPLNKLIIYKKILAVAALCCVCGLISHVPIVSTVSISEFLHPFKTTHQHQQQHKKKRGYKIQYHVQHDSSKHDV